MHKSHAYAICVLLTADDTYQLNNHSADAVQSIAIMYPSGNHFHWYFVDVVRFTASTLELTSKAGVDRDRQTTQQQPLTIFLQYWRDAHGRSKTELKVSHVNLTWTTVSWDHNFEVSAHIVTTIISLAMSKLGGLGIISGTLNHYGELPCRKRYMLKSITCRIYTINPLVSSGAATITYCYTWDRLPTFWTGFNSSYDRC